MGRHDEWSSGRDGRRRVTASVDALHGALRRLSERFPRGTPRPVLEQLTAALQKAVADPEVRSRLESMDISAVSADQATPAGLRVHLNHEIDTLGGLSVTAGVKAD